MAPRRRRGATRRSGGGPILSAMATTLGFSRPIRCENEFPEAGGSYSVTTTDTLPQKATSATLTFASVAPVSWHVVFFNGSGERTTESLPIVTCGNSLTVKYRNSKVSDYGQFTPNTDPLMSVFASGAGRCDGVVYFAGKGFQGDQGSY